jgi:hypothetical protein
MESAERVSTRTHQSDEVVRDRIRSVVLEMLAAGERITCHGIRAHGVHTATSRINWLRRDLVHSGELPPGAMTRNYQRSPHQNGRTVVQPPEPERPRKPKRTRSEITLECLRLYGFGLMRRQFRREP